MKKFIVFIITFILVVSVSGCKNKKEDESFKYWNESKSLTALTQYVKDVTDEKSDHFIPVEDRVAVFDMDGTLCGELFPTYIEYLLLEYRVLDDSSYTCTDEDTIATANLIRETGRGSFPSDMALRHAYAQAKAFEGMEINEFQNYVKNFLKRSAAGFNNLTYAKSFYLPMLEVLSFLQSNSFITYIVSGSDRYICRAAACEITNVPANQVIGMDVKLEATNQGETDGLDYQFKDNDVILRTDELLIKNLKMNKVFQIAQEIGKQPVLAFGNSSGDLSMELYTITNNKYQSLAFMLIADDETRDYGNTEKANKLKENWEGYGFNVISMKDDFKTIYGYDVTKTE